MSFRFYTNAISRASRNFAAGLFIVGLLLIGFGFLVYILWDLFAILASIVFFVVEFMNRSLSGWQSGDVLAEILADGTDMAGWRKCCFDSCLCKTPWRAGHLAQHLHNELPKECIDSNTLAMCGKSVGSGLERFTVRSLESVFSINCEPGTVNRFSEMLYFAKVLLLTWYRTSQNSRKSMSWPVELTGPGRRRCAISSGQEG